MKSSYRKLLIVIGFLVVAVGAAGACSSNEEVGADLKTDLEKAINELSTTSAPQESTTTAAVANLGETTTTAAPAAATTAATAKATTTVPQSLQVVVTINGDTSGKSQFDPLNVQARVGTPIVFKNTDTKMRYVLSPDGGWRSPELQPGQEWTFKPTQVGTFQLKDGTRPYVNGSLQVY